MRYIPVFLIFYLLVYSQCCAALSRLSNPALVQLDSLSANNLIYSNTVTEEEILSLCAIAENKARSLGDYNSIFRIEQISVSSSCRKGDMGLAINKAQKMYEEAKSRENNLGIALSIQSLGNTYMYSGQYKQAESVLIEAAKYMENTDCNICQIRLTIQQLHVAMSLKDMQSMNYYLKVTNEQLKKIPSESNYHLYIQYYQILYYIGIDNKEKAEESLKLLMADNKINKYFPRWHYELSSYYYRLLGNHEKALSYCDSTLSIIQINGNINEYKNQLIHKAKILQSMDSLHNAYLVYERGYYLSDSLNMEDYSRQIDSLRITYWVDQMEVNNAEAYNGMLTWILIYALIILIIAIIIIWIARKGNQRLITSRKKLELKRQEAADSIQSKSLFLSNMSHELRTPLTAIVGFSGILTAEDDLDSEMKQQCGELIKQNSDLLLKLLNDVVDLSALKGKSMKFTFETTDAVTLCQKVTETVEKVKRTSAQLCFSTKLDRLELNTDSGRLQQVLINLLINATKFTPNGRITLALDLNENQDEAVFSVEDTGCGIPLEKQPHIFERFEKLHEGIQGAGLGLSICQLIIERIGGKIWIDPTYTQGARFIFTHPLTQKNI